MAIGSTVYNTTCGTDSPGTGIPRLGNNHAVTTSKIIPHQMTAFASNASLRPAALPQGSPTVSQGSPTQTRDPSQAASIPSITNSGSSGGDGTPGNSLGPNGGTNAPGQTSPPISQQASGNPSSSVEEGTNNELSATRGDYTAQQSQTAAPDDERVTF